MKRMFLHVVWLLLSSTAILHADAPPAGAPEPVGVTYLANEAYAPEKGYVVIRSAFEVQGPPHRWIALDVEFRLNQAVPLVRIDDKVFMKRWNNLFLPESPAPARWTDCRLDVDFREFEQAKNLPRDKTFIVWAMGLIYDHAAGKYVDSGWPVRAPLVLTTDALGRIQRALTPALSPVRYEHPSDKTIDARRADIRTNHLKLLPGVQAYQAVRRDGTPVTVLTNPNGQIWKPSGFIAAFEPIDSAEKAEELVRLMHPGAVIVQTRPQYDAVIDAARRLGWLAEDLPRDDPKFLGLRTTPVEGFGWRVEAMLIEPRNGRPGDLAAWDYCVGTDGLVGAKRNVLLCGPGGKSKTPVHTDVYAAMLQSHLGGLSPEVVQPRIVPTDTVAKLPLPAKRSAEDFIHSTEEPPSAKQAARRSAKPQADPTEPPGTITTPGPTPIRKSK